MIPRPLVTLARRLSLVLIVLIEAASLLLKPTRMGRLLRKVSLPRLRDNPLRTTVTSLGVVIAVAAVVSAVLVNRSIVRSAQSTVEDVAGKADLQIHAVAGGFEESALDVARSVKGVFKVTPVLEQTVLLREPSAHGERLLLLGLDLASSEDNYFRQHNAKEYQEINRDPLRFLDSTSNIVVSQSLARRLGRGLHDRVALDTPFGLKNFEIWGLIDDSELANAYGGQVAVMHYQSMQAAFDRGTTIDRIDVAVEPGSDSADVREDLRRTFGDRLRVEEPTEKNSRIAKMLVGLNTAMTAASVIAVMIAMFLIYNTMLISIVQRKSEIGTLRALGATANQLTRLLTLEGALVGAVASILGLGVGTLLASLMVGGMSSSVSQIYMNVGAPRLRFDALLLLRCFVLGTVASAIAAYLAARSTAHMPTIENLAGSANMNRYRGHARLLPADVAGLVLLAMVPILASGTHFTKYPVAEVASAPALLLGAALFAPRAVQAMHVAIRWAGRSLGMATMMANRNLARDLMRSAITTGALILGMGMATGFAVFISSFVHHARDWVEQAIPADLFVTSSAPGLVKHTPLPGSIGDELERLPEIEAVEHVRLADFEYHDTTVKLVATDAAANSANSKMMMVQGKQHEAMREVAAGAAALINESFARNFGLTRGDHLVLASPSGPVQLRVSGVYVDYLSDRGVVLLDRTVYLRHWGDTTVDMFKVHTRPRTNLESLRRKIAAQYGAKYDLMVATGREFATRLTGQIDQVFSIMRALQAVALIIAAMGVVNALSANVLDRTREIGVLRAVGMLRAQVRRIVVVEATLIGACGALLGALVGVVAGRLILSTAAVAVVGWTIPLAPNWLTVLNMSLTLIVASAAAGWIPSRRAAALKIPDAVAHR